MAQAKGDPDALERFAGSLQHCVDSLNQVVLHLKCAFRTLGETWTDEKRARFEEDFERLLEHVHRFSEDAEEQIPYLNKLASRLRDYLQS